MGLKTRSGLDTLPLKSWIAARLATLLLGALVAHCNVDAADIVALQQAASAGDATALLQLGDMHESGEEFGHDLAAAAYYFRLAAERGDATAQYRLGQYHWAGLGVAEDVEESYRWLSSAAISAGDAAPLAESLLPEVARKMTPVQLEQVKRRIGEFRPISGPAQLHLATLRAQPPTIERIARFLPSGDCGRLQITKQDGGGYRVAGYIREGSQRPPLDPEATHYFSAHAVEVNLAELIHGHCRVIETITKRTQELGATGSVAIRDGDGRTPERFHDGAYVIVAISGLNDDRFIAVDFFLQDGSVVHMFPNTDLGSALLRAQQSLTLGEPGTGQKSWQIGPPFGSELLVVFTSSSPLYAGQRPEVEATEEYLSYLRTRLSNSSTETNADVRALYTIVKTVP